ncbi:MAG: phosphatidylglycerophosphatase A, partial [Acidobacteriota bacterium]|nr:phosphatidylglycerophosphatase A [Acidobacteriota bacterium]
YKLEWPYFLLIVLILFFSGVMISTRVAAELKSKDPRIIVMDEAAGQLIILFNMNPSWFNVLLAFFLFRFFDIIKPYPIKKVENFPRGWGIMMDDIVAAVLGGILINVYLLLR